MSVYISSGQLNTSLTVNNGIDLFVLSGGTSIATVVNSSVEQVAGVDIDATITPGSIQGVESGGLATSASVGSGGTYSPAPVSGGEQVVEPGGEAIGTTINGGGWEDVAGGQVSGVIVSSGGLVTITTHGLALGTVLLSGGESLDGSVDSQTFVGLGGFQLVSSGSTAVGAAIGVGGALVSPSTTATSGPLSGLNSANANQFVLYGGTASDTVVSGGAAEWVWNSGTASATMVNSGGEQVIFSGSTVTSTVVSSGGYLFVASGGVAQNVTVEAGGTLTLASGGSATPQLSTLDTSTHQTMAVAGTVYSGPVAGLDFQYIYTGVDSLNIAPTTSNWFIHAGGSFNAVALLGGTNVVDAGTGSNFLTGGTGSDTFFLDTRNAASDIWDSVINFHAGDAATIWGVTSNGYALDWENNQGAAGYQGLTLHVTAAGKPTASLTLGGFSKADLGNGKLSVTFGTVSGNNYMYVKDNS